MSTALLSTLTLGGIALLSFFAYAVHKVEEHRQEKSRRSQLHRDRARDLAFVAEVLPREAVDPELFKALYHNVELHLTHAVALDSENVELRERLNGVAQTNKLVQRGAEVPQAPLGGTLGEQMKDSQRALKMLKDFILQQHKAGVLTKSGATKFVRTLQDINLRVMLRGLIGQAKHNVREGHKSLPIHYYQLAYNELLKANQGNRHIEEMTELAEMIKVLKDAQGRVGEVGEETDPGIANPQPDANPAVDNAPGASQRENRTRA